MPSGERCFTPEATAISWTVPDVESVYLQAEVIYPSGIEDAAATNNIIDLGPIRVVEGDCGRSNQCRVVLNDVVLWICGPCFDNPALCEGVSWPKLPRLCDVIDCIPWPCLSGLSCMELPFEVLFSQPDEVYVTLLGNDQPVTRTTRLQQPIKVDGVIYHHRLVLKARQGVSYRLRVSAGKEALKDPGMQLGVRLRPWQR